MIELKRILIPTDFSDNSAVALKYAIAFADQFGAAVDVIHVLEPPPAGLLLSYQALDEVSEQMKKNAQQQLEDLQSQWSDYCFPVTQTVLEGHPFVEIVRFARENNSDLIVLGTHGRGAVGHMLMGSVAEKIVRKSPCPVLTIRHPEHEFIHPDTI